MHRLTLAELKTHRDTLRQTFERQGGRGVELADQIDAIERRIDRMEKRADTSAVTIRD